MARSFTLVMTMLFLLGGCASRTNQVYPAKWSEPVSKTGAPSWEILPQEAGPGEVILSKRNELGILSNFAATPFVYRGVKYASVEGFWQMMKYPQSDDDPRAKSTAVQWKFTRDQVAQMTSFEAKHAGDLGEKNMEILAIDWVTFEGNKMPYRSKVRGEHYRLIVEAMHEKIMQNPKVRQILISTRNLILKPDHHQGLDDPPEWKYFEIWMQIRQQIQTGQLSQIDRDELHANGEMHRGDWLANQ